MIKKKSQGFGEGGAGERLESKLRVVAAGGGGGGACVRPRNFREGKGKSSAPYPVVVNWKLQGEGLN